MPSSHKSVLAAIIATATLRIGAMDYYVSPSGSDSNDGSSGAPFLTISKARDALRLVDHSAEEANVWLADGVYLLSTAITFTSADSGSASYQVNYKASPGAVPRIMGGLLITNWVAVEDPVKSRLTADAQTHVYQSDLTASGVASLSPLARYGYPVSLGNGWNELFEDGAPMTLARYPNTGYLHMGAVTANTNFVCSDARPFTWSQSDAWMAMGFWHYDWRTSAEWVTLTNPTVTIAPSGYTETTVAGKRYFFQNVVEELDSAGEYYLDRTNLVAYAWPTGDIATSEFYLSTLTNAFYAASASPVSYVTFDGLTFEDFTKYCAQIIGGTGVTFTNCVFKNSLLIGLSTAASHLTVTGCTFQDTGQKGVSINAGTRSTLVAGNDLVTNCVFRRFGRIDPCYQPGVNLAGVSNFVANCVFEDGPHSAIIFTGNEHRILNNTFQSLCQNTSDAGAIYAMTDWTYGGNIIQGNTFSDITKLEYAMDEHVYGVYLDQCTSGITVVSNLFIRVDIPAFNNGGKHNIWGTNTFVLSREYAFYAAIGKTNWTNALVTALNAVPYDSEPWASRYPWLQEITPDNWLYPTNSAFSDNWSFGSQWLLQYTPATDSMELTNNKPQPYGLRTLCVF